MSRTTPRIKTLDSPDTCEERAAKALCVNARAALRIDRRNPPALWSYGSRYLILAAVTLLEDAADESDPTKMNQFVAFAAARLAVAVDQLEERIRREKKANGR